MTSSSSLGFRNEAISWRMKSLTYEYKLEALDFIIKNNLASLRQRICENLKYIETRQQKGYMKCLNIKNKQKNFSVPFD